MVSRADESSPVSIIGAVGCGCDRFGLVVSRHPCELAVWESDGASGKEPLYAAAAFDLDRRVVSWIGADVHALAEDPKV